MSGVSESLNYYHGVIPHPEFDQWEIKFIKRFLPKNLSSLVDLGCGTGEFLQYAKNFYPKTLGVDLNPTAILSCWEKGVAAIEMDVTKTSINSHTFDIVRAQNILEHLTNPEKLVTEASRLLKKNGFLIIHVPTHFSTLYPITNFWDDYTHVRPFTKKGLYRILEDFGFEIIHCQGYTLGRNKWESLLGKILEKFIPFSWFVIAKRAQSHESY